MHTFQTTDPKVARRCRYDQHRRQKTSLTVEGSLVEGLVHSVMEARSSNPTRWIITIIPNAPKEEPKVLRPTSRARPFAEDYF